MNKNHLKKLLFGLFSLYVVVSIGFYFLSYEQLQVKKSETDMLEPYSPIGELLETTEIRQPFRVDADRISSISLMLSTFIRANSSTTDLYIEDVEGNRLVHREIPSETLQDNAILKLDFSPPIDIQPSKIYQLVLSTKDGVQGNTITAWYGNSIATARGDFEIRIDDWERLCVGGEKIDGKLCFQLSLEKNCGSEKFIGILLLL